MQDGDEVLHVLGKHQALGAVGGARAEEELFTGLQQVDGSDLHRGREMLVQVEDGLLEVRREGAVRGAGQQRGSRGRSEEITPIHIRIG